MSVTSNITVGHKLANYVRKHTVLAMLVASALFWALNVSLAFLSELDNLKGNYTFVAAFFYILWRSPQYLYEFLPMSALVGAVVGLGNLATHSELTVMRAAGLSLYKIVSWVVQSALILVIFALILNQYVLPYTNAKAKYTKHPHKAEKVGEIRGFWSKQRITTPPIVTNNKKTHENNKAVALNTSKNNSATTQTANRIVFIEYASANGEILGLKAWDINNQDEIMQVLTAESGKYLSKGVWQLTQVNKVLIHADGHSEKQQFESLATQLNILPDYIHLLTRPIADLSITDTYRYNQYLSAQNKVSAEHRLAFWQKLLSPFALLALVIIACSFVFGSLRQQSMGLRIVIAILCGLIFSYIQDLTGFMALIYHGVSPIWFVSVPIILSGLLGLFLLNRKR